MESKIRCPRPAVAGDSGHPSQETLSPEVALACDITQTSERGEKKLVPSQKASECRAEDEVNAVKPAFSQKKKWALLAVFSFSLLVDQWIYVSFFIYTPYISTDFDIPQTQRSWVINSYLITFGSTLLFFGRVSDLFPPALVFSSGFLILAALSLVTSFLPEMYSFFVFRAISGIAGAALIPSAFKLITAIFEDHELGKALMVYTAAAPLGGGTGVILAGVVQLIPKGGQMTGWRWFLRILTVMIAIPALGSLFWIPQEVGREQSMTKMKWKQKVKHLDLIGCALMFVVVLLLIFSLTMGGDHGFGTAVFIAPFLISIILLPVFVYWESRLPDGYPLLSLSTFKLPNVSVFLALSFILFSFWSVCMFALINTYVTYRKESAILVAVRHLPMPITSVTVTTVLAQFPRITRHTRLSIGIGMILAIAGYVLLAESGHQDGLDYWKFIFPGFVIGSGGAMTVYSAINVGVMTAVPPSTAGTAGALLQVGFQIGTTVSLAVQAGLLTVHEGGLGNWKNVQASFYFEMGWLALGLVVFLVGYRALKAPTSDEEKGRAIAAH